MLAYPISVNIYIFPPNNTEFPEPHRNRAKRVGQTRMHANHFCQRPVFSLRPRPRLITAKRLVELVLFNDSKTRAKTLFAFQDEFSIDASKIPIVHKL